MMVNVTGSQCPVCIVKRDTVDIFDSVNGTSINSNMFIKMQIANLVRSKSGKITLRSISFQHQQGGTDCGLFALAAATTLCHGGDPFQHKYDQPRMRAHLASCLRANEMEPFPSTQTRPQNRKVRQTYTVDVYCECRLPDNRSERMIECRECKEWFHQSCQEIPTSSFYNFEQGYSCRTCRAHGEASQNPMDTVNEEKV